MTSSAGYNVYVVTDESWGKSHYEVAESAIKGGANVIQLRDKNKDDESFMKDAWAIRRLTEEEQIKFIVNDRVEIAREVKADGVHIGQNDDPIKKIKKTIPVKMIIGISATTYAEAIIAEQQGATYIGAGPVYYTTTKDDAANPFGVKELKRICQAVRIPVVAIGGITLKNIEEVVLAGANGAAIVSAIAGASDIIEATIRFKMIWRKYGSN